MKENNMINLTPDERNNITKSLEGKCCDNCNNGCCTVPVEEKIGLDEDGLPQGSYCMGWQNEEIVVKCKVLRKSSIYELR